MTDRSPAFPFFLLTLLLLAFVPLRRLHAHQERQSNDYAFSNGATIRLSSDWVQLAPVTTPPTSLVSSAPPMNFYEFLSFQNTADYSHLEVALSNNPFIGRDPYWLDSQIHRPAAEGGLLAYLFYFFFPPPQPCLGNAISQYNSAARNSSGDSNEGPRDVRISVDCEYAPTPADFYSYLISPSVTFRREGGSEHREGAIRDFYLQPMDQRDVNDVTFFIFEAQGRHELSLDAANHFNLPDSLRGAQGDFLWAIGAPSPFPFVRDVTRQNVPLIHVVYAGIGLGPNKKPELLRLLKSVHIQ